jgi:hypothetical protein
MTGTEGAVINVHEWFSRATLEVMGDSEIAIPMIRIDTDTIYSSSRFV